MQELVEFSLRSVLDHPDQISLNVVESEASVLFELSAAESDRQRLLADDRALLESIQAVLAASSGRQKAVLDLVDGDDEGAADEE